MVRPISFVLSLLFLVTFPAVHAVHAQSENKQDHAVKVLRSLHWIRGPSIGQIATEATLSIPNHYVFLGPNDSKKFEELSENIYIPGEHLFMPDDLAWFAIFRFVDTGYVKDDDSIDAAAVLDTIRINTEAANAKRRENGWRPLNVIGWYIAPRYDPQSHQLEWAIVAE